MRTDDRPTVMAVCSKLWRSKITVEPTVVIFYILYDFILFFENNLLLQKSCRNVSLIVEPDLNTPCDNEQLGQQYTAMANSIRTSTMYVLATVSSVFWSVWSDNHGRDCRPMLYLPLIGMVVQCCFDLANSYYWHWDPSLVTYVSAIVQGVSGSKVSMYLGALLYLANVIRVEDRSFRFGLLLALEYGSILIGSGLAGYVNRGLGFSGSFAVCLVLAIGALLVSYVKIKDPTVPCDDTDEKKKKKLSIAQSLNPLLLLEGIPIVFRKRSGNKRAVLICLLLVGPPYTVSLFGKRSSFDYFIIVDTPPSVTPVRFSPIGSSECFRHKHAHTHTYIYKSSVCTHAVQLRVPRLLISQIICSLRSTMFFITFSILPFLK